jgi:hypothetical protein
LSISSTPLERQWAIQPVKDMNLPPDLSAIDMASVLAAAPTYGLEFIQSIG